MTNQIQIYVADLAAYNAGFLHGEWINTCQDPDFIREEISKMLKKSPIQGAEEYAIHDYEGFEEYRLDEYASIDSAHEIACFIDEFSNFGAELLSYFSDIDVAREYAEEKYIGCYKSLADYAQEITEETTAIPEQLKYYIDYEAMARDMKLSGEVLVIEKGFEEIHLFWND